MFHGSVVKFCQLKVERVTKMRNRFRKSKTFFGEGCSLLLGDESCNETFGSSLNVLLDNWKNQSQLIQFDKVISYSISRLLRSFL